ILAIDKAQEEEWENYKAKLDIELAKGLKIETDIQEVKEIYERLGINKLWDIRLTVLGKWYHRYHEKLNYDVSEADRKQFETEIGKINIKHGFEIDNLTKSLWSRKREANMKR
ncbi:6250_t:CDS:2, partial [Gigaspora rosea]